MHSQGLPVYLRFGYIDKAKVKFLAYKSGESSKGLSMILRINAANKELMNGTHASKQVKNYFACLIWRSITSAMHSLARTLDSSIRCA